MSNSHLSFWSMVYNMLFGDWFAAIPLDKEGAFAEFNETVAAMHAAVGTGQVDRNRKRDVGGQYHACDHVFILLSLIICLNFRWVTTTNGCEFHRNIDYTGNNDM
jgi:hypothetical protein